VGGVFVQLPCAIQASAAVSCDIDVSLPLGLGKFTSWGWGTTAIFLGIACELAYLGVIT
jgi:hypothetical protein